MVIGTTRTKQNGKKTNENIDPEEQCMHEFIEVMSIDAKPGFNECTQMCKIARGIEGREYIGDQGEEQTIRGDGRAVMVMESKTEEHINKEAGTRKENQAKREEKFGEAKDQDDVKTEGIPIKEEEERWALLKTEMKGGNEDGEKLGDLEEGKTEDGTRILTRQRRTKSKYSEC